MAVENAQAAASGDAADHDATKQAEVLRTRQVSGYASRPVQSSLEVRDEQRELAAQTHGEGEETRIVPGQLIDSLREASRHDSQPPHSFSHGGSARPTPLEPPPVQDSRVARGVGVAARQSVLRRFSLIAAISAGVLAVTGLGALQLGLWRTPFAPLVSSARPKLVPSSRPKIAVVVQLRRAEALQSSSSQPPQDAAPESAPSSGSLCGASTEESLLCAVAAAQPKAAPEAAKEASLTGEAQRKWQRALNSGQGHLSAREFDSAVVSFKRAIRQNPNDPQAYAGLAASQLERGKWNEAVRAFRKAIELAPQDAAQRRALQRAFEQSDTKEVASTSYGEATEGESGPTE